MSEIDFKKKDVVQSDVVTPEDNAVVLNEENSSQGTDQSNQETVIAAVDRPDQQEHNRRNRNVYRRPKGYHNNNQNQVPHHQSNIVKEVNVVNNQAISLNENKNINAAFVPAPQEIRPLEERALGDLNALARRLGIVGGLLMARDQLVERIKFIQANPDFEIEVAGVLEKLPDGFGFLRSEHYDYVSGPDDVYVSPSQIRRFGLRTGDIVSGVIRKPKENEKYFALLKVNTIDGKDPSALADRPHFDRLSPLHPSKKFNLEYESGKLATRIMDLFTPVGRGQRGLIVAPPKVGKTLLLKEIAQALVVNHPEVVLIVLLVDERPEEVSDMKRTLRNTSAKVISSTFDEAADRHVQVAEAVLEMAKRLVESGKDVVILLDSLNRLARAYNTVAPASGKILTGGVDANALQRPKRFFGAARATEEGGSLTILASAMIDTGSRMDEVIYEEFKGTGNMEMHMTRKLSNRRVFPAFDLLVSGTRRDDLLHHDDDLNKVWVLQKFLSTMNTIEAVEFLIEKMGKHKVNREFLDSMNKREKVAHREHANGDDFS